MTRRLGRISYNNLALLLLICAVVVGATLVLNRAHFYSGPHAAEMSPIGHTGELPPVW